MKKRVLSLLVLCFMLVGCSNYNDSPESVSKEMVKRMSSGDYSNVEELLYLEENTFIDGKSFESYLNKNDINIEGNKNYEVTKVEDYTTFTYVYVKLDNNKGLQIRTKEKEGKWYIDIGDEYDDNLIIKVPHGSTVKLNDKVLDYNKYVKIEEDSLRHNYNYSMNISVDVYTIPYLLSGSYNLVVEKDNAKTISTEIKSDKYYYSSIYSDKEYFADRDEEYLLKMEPTEELKTNTETYINSFYNQMFEHVNSNSDFSVIDSIENEKKEYNKLLENKEDIGSYSDTIYNNFRLNNIKITDIYYYGDDNIIIKYECEYTYHYKFTYTNFMASMGETFNEDKDEIKTINSVLQIEKVNDGFALKSGYNLVPRI